MGEPKVMEALEAAAEGSRELDELITAALHGEALGLIKDSDGDWWATKGGYGGKIAIQPYTTSVDAALTLVPPGAVWHLMTDYGDLNRAKIGPAGRPYASIYNDADAPAFVEEDGATPALALCLAALRARTTPSSVADGGGE